MVSIHRMSAVAALALSFASSSSLLGQVTAQVGSGETSPAGSFLRSCTVAAIPARCGTFEVWENRAAGTGRKIPLRIVVLAAEDSTPRPDPVFMLAGGPGQAATEIAEGILPQFQAVRRHRDIVLIDQRGTGGSNPLTCAGGMAAMEGGPDSVRACANELSRRADLTQYTSDNAADDLDEVREALGYRTINLVGVSYGTRLAQVYARRHPRSVRTITLRAIASMGYNIPLDGARAAERELRHLFADCAADAACAAAFPRLAAELDSVAARAAREPARVRVPQPGGDSVEVVLDADLLWPTLYALLLGPTRQQMPLLIHRAATDGLGALGPIAAQVRRAVYGPLPTGMYLSVLCAEDAPRLTAADRKEIAGAFGGLSANIGELCDAWPRATVPADFHRPVRWAGPALLLSGDSDPATGVEQGEAVAREWPGARHVVLPATAHGPMFPGCMRELVGEFIERGSADGLDTACVASLRWAPFATGAPAR
ncbi:MAG TPA: alpha/beta fold hydrolase [Longimicrobium sp.]|nr:alpha/beta fold hydrolase [Longimicrobium sp.]